MAKEEALDFRAVQDEIRSGTLHGIYLFDGEEETLKQSVWNAVRRALLPEGLEQMNEDILENPAADALIAAVETLPFMSGKRLVTVRDHAGLTARAEAEDRLLDYLPRVPDSTVLIFYQTGAANGTKKLTKALKRFGRCVRFGRLKEAELTGWVIRSFRDRGVVCGAGAASFLVFRCGTDTGVLGTEIAKLAAFVQEGREVTQADITQVAAPSAECRVFDLTDAVVAGQEARAFALLRDLRLTGSSDVMILAMLLRQYRLMRTVKIMQLEKKTPAEMKTAMGLADFQLRSLTRQASGCTGGQVRRAVDWLLGAEAGFKGGTLPQDGLVDTVMLKLFADRRPKDE